MDLAEYVRIIRLRWRIIAAVFAITIIAAFIFLPSPGPVAPGTNSTHTATTTLIINANATPKLSLDVLTLYAVQGQVPLDAAKALGLRPTDTRLAGSPSTPTSARSSAGVTRSVGVGSTELTVDPDAPTGSVTITATDVKPKKAEAAANALASALTSWANSNSTSEYKAKLALLQSEHDQLYQEYQQLQSQLAVVTAAKNQADIDAVKSQADSALGSLRGVEGKILDARSNPPSWELQTLQKAVVKTIPKGGFQAPRSRKTRLAIAGLIGLAIGLGVALVVHRLDNRVHGVHATEAASRFPVLGEIPYVRVARSERFAVHTRDRPTSIVAEAYRGLRTSLCLLAMARSEAARQAAQAAGDEVERRDTPHVVLVTSPGPNEGKSVTAANLATAFGETGQNVLLVDLDYRRQKLHRYVGASARPSVSELESPTSAGEEIDRLAQPTDMLGVRFVAAAENDETPAHAILLARAVIEAAKSHYDVIVLDAPPLLLTNDAYDFLGSADAVLLVVRDGRSRRRGVERASQLLRRLNAPLLGVALLGVTTASGGGYGYYGYYGYAMRYAYGYGYGDRPRRSIFRRDRDQTTKRENRPVPADRQSAGADGPRD